MKKLIFLVMLLLVAGNAVGQDYLTVFFKDGSNESFYLGAIKNFYASKYDSLGVIHEDYQTQIIETTKKVFIYDLAEIDSVSFTKFNEQEVKKNFKSALSASDAVFSKCDSIGDLSQYIDELRDVEGIEYVSYDNNSLYVKVKDWLTIAYYFDTKTTEDTLSLSLKQTLRKGKKLIQQYSSPYEDFTAVEAIAHSPVGLHADDESEVFLPLKKKFDDCGISAKINHPSLSNGFYTDEIFKHDIIFYSGHGGYDKENDLHTLVTADECGTRPKNYVLTDEDISQIYNWIYSLLQTDAVSDDEISIGIYGDFRSNGWIKVYGASVSQKYIQNSPNEFSEPAIIFMAACKTLSENSKMASVFLKKGALAFFGSEETQSGGVLIGKSYFENLLNGMSMEGARQNIDWLQTTNTMVDWVHSDYKVYYHAPSEPKRQFHLFNTSTKPVDPRTVRIEYVDNRKVTITGVTTLLDTEDPKVEFGFKYGIESDNLDKSVKGKHDSSIVDESGNFVFTAKLNLSDYQKYYFQAYTYDGYYYNLGGIQKIKFFDDEDVIAKDLAIDPSSASLKVGESLKLNLAFTPQNVTETVVIWNNSNEEVVGFHNGEVTALSPGHATITAQTIDGSDITATCEIDVSYVDLTISQNSVSMEPDNTATISITSGNGNYGVKSSNEEVATAYIDGEEAKEVCIKAIDVGTATITVTDNLSNETADILVTVNRKLVDLALESFDPVTLVIGESATVGITSGNGIYDIYNSNDKVVTVTVEDERLKIDAVSAGTATIIVTDKMTTQTASIEVTVLANLSIAIIGNIDLKVGESTNVKIISGNNDYTLDNSSPSVASASVVGLFITVEALSEGSTTITIMDNKTKQTASFDVTVTSMDIPAEAIDLGLPSGILWASYNVGATTPEEYGGYYAWGETKEKDTYFWTTYTHCDGVANSCHDIGTDISGTEYDVAHVRWGGEWRMPTAEEFKELVYKCDHQTTTQNGVYGFKFTGPNGNSIFFPAAGYHFNTGINKAGSSGEYWSSTVRENKNYAYDTSMSVDYVYWDCYINRFAGLPVRPVKYSEPTLADLVELKGTTVHIAAVGAGSTIITVKDDKSGQTASIDVTVTENSAPSSYLTCPDDHHPHLIDMGLPLGTKWACCNVGASKPEDYGNYYAWGETETKSTYNWETYIHKTGDYNCIDLGPNIANTNYDVAHVQWGSPWQMPSGDEIKTLIEKCETHTETLNGVKGISFIGPNGGKLFFPIGGIYDEDSVRDQGRIGSYWASTCSNDWGAEGLDFVYSSVSFNEAGVRILGHSVRPVISGNE